MGNLETNELHRQVHKALPHFRTFPTTEGSIMTKSGDTKKITTKEAKILFEKVEKGDFMGVIDVEIEFTTEKEGLKIAKKFGRLAENPAVKLNVQFKRVENAKN